jgi:predicted flap endonuclease-1-like 5' DNA nuclease
MTSPKVLGGVRWKEGISKRKEKTMAKIVDVEGIGKKYANTMIKAGVKSTDALLKAGSTPKGRKELAEKTGIGDALILRWVNHVDLYRIKGVGSEYSELLEAAGVDTIPELAQRKAANLVQKFVEVNAVKKLVRKLPVESQVANWIEQAKKLKRVIMISLRISEI